VRWKKARHRRRNITITNTPDYADLVAQAATARARAYCPYSGFAVGAAVLTASGRVFPGCNVENAAYPATICAERAALLGAYATGEREIVALAVIADTAGPVSPCGTCRQVIHELAPTCTVALANTRGDMRLTTPQELLPGGFMPEDLPK
jgi:cytidine deaminase